jgi:hypothetical protein
MDLLREVGAQQELQTLDLDVTPQQLLVCSNPFLVFRQLQRLERPNRQIRKCRRQT